MDIQAIIIAGGKGKRLNIDIPKCMLELNGYKLIDICIDNLRELGIRDYVFLLGYKYEQVLEYISKYEIKFRYSIDKEPNWGKGKALKYAILNNTIDKNRRGLIIYPDDLLINAKHYLSEFIDSHIEYVNEHGIIASMMLAKNVKYPYGVARLDKNGIVYSFKEKPLLRILTNVGIYIYESKVYNIVIDNIDMNKDGMDLESIVLPILANMKKLRGFVIDGKDWLPINTIKDYEEAKARFK